MLGSKRLFLSVLFLVLIPFFAYAQQTPETRIISGVSGTVSHGDVVFMWMGQSTDRPILGYYYTLGNAEPVFTDATQVTCFDLFDGIYSFSISAIDIDDQIDTCGSRVYSGVRWKSYNEGGEEAESIIRFIDYNNNVN